MKGQQNCPHFSYSNKEYKVGVAWWSIELLLLLLSGNKTHEAKLMTNLCI